MIKIRNKVGKETAAVVAAAVRAVGPCRRVRGQLQLLSRKSSQVLRDGREARRVFVLSHQTVGHESARNAPSIEPGSPLPHVPPSGQVVGGC